MKHKWHKEIVAWADGAEIEFKYLRTDNEWSIWVEADKPLWDTTGEVEYRIKPQPKEPKYLYVYFDNYINRIAITDAKSNVNAVDYLGKFKLEVDDE